MNVSALFREARRVRALYEGHLARQGVEEYRTEKHDVFTRAARSVSHRADQRHLEKALP